MPRHRVGIGHGAVPEGSLDAAVAELQADPGRGKHHGETLERSWGKTMMKMVKIMGKPWENGENDGENDGKMVKIIGKRWDMLMNPKAKMVICHVLSWMFFFLVCERINLY